MNFNDFAQEITTRRGMTTPAENRRQRSSSPDRQGPAEAQTAPPFGMASQNQDTDPGKLGCRYSVGEQRDIMSPMLGMQTPVNRGMCRDGGQGGAPNKEYGAVQTQQGTMSPPGVMPPLGTNVYAGLGCRDAYNKGQAAQNTQGGPPKKQDGGQEGTPNEQTRQLWTGQPGQQQQQPPQQQGMSCSMPYQRWCEEGGRCDGTSMPPLPEWRA